MNRFISASRLFVPALLVFVLVSGCVGREAARKDITAMAENTQQKLTTIQPKAEPASALIEENTPWYGATAIPAQSGQFLPEKMEADNALVLTFEQPLTLEQVAARIQAATNLRVLVERAGTPSADLSTGGATAPGGAAAAGAEGDIKFLPADGLEVTGGRTIWQGKLSNLLDQINDRFDAEWKYSGNTIKISQQIVRTFMLHALAGTTDLGGSVKTGSTGAEGGLPQQSVDSTSKLAVWDEIQKAIETIVGSKARASYSPATGTITLAGYPSAVNAAEDYLRLQNKLRLRRVSLEAKVLTVKLNKQYDNNFDLDVVIKNAFSDQSLVFSSGRAGGTSVGRSLLAGVLSPSNATAPDSTQVVINALSAVAERVAIEYSGSLVTLSDQPAPLQVATKKSYVARVSGSATDGASSTTLEPGTIDIGLSMNILPRVIEQDRVMLRVALGITDLVDFVSFTSGTSSLQLPTVDSTGFLQNAVLQSGETLVLAGFERKNANDTQTGIGKPTFWGLGGGSSYGQGREIRVLLITATVMPEEPVNVIQP